MLFFWHLVSLNVTKMAISHQILVPPYQFGRVCICAARPRCLRCGKCCTPGGTPRRIFRRSRRKRSIVLFSSTKPRDWKAKNRFHPFLGQDAQRTARVRVSPGSWNHQLFLWLQTWLNSDFKCGKNTSKLLLFIFLFPCGLICSGAYVCLETHTRTHTSTFLVIRSPLPPPVLPSTSLWCSQLSQNMCSCGRCRSADLESAI